MNKLPSCHAGYIGNTISLKYSPIMGSFAYLSKALFSIPRLTTEDQHLVKAVSVARNENGLEMPDTGRGVVGIDTLVVDQLDHIRHSSIGGSVEGIR